MSDTAQEPGKFEASEALGYADLLVSGVLVLGVYKLGQNQKINNEK